MVMAPARRRQLPEIGCELGSATAGHSSGDLRHAAAMRHRRCTSWHCVGVSLLAVAAVAVILLLLLLLLLLLRPFTAPHTTPRVCQRGSFHV